MCIVLIKRGTVEGGAVCRIKTGVLYIAPVQTGTISTFCKCDSNSKEDKGAKGYRLRQTLWISRFKVANFGETAMGIQSADAADIKGCARSLSSRTVQNTKIAYSLLGDKNNMLYLNIVDLGH